MASPPPRLLLATSNGTGMGHLTRQLAVALAVGDRAQPTLFSLSIALPVVDQFGFPGEYCPSHDAKWIPSARWHRYLQERLTALARETGSGAFMFDGVAPYPGLVRARAKMPDVHFAWMRRGMWRPGTNEAQLAKSAAFDTIVEPGDLAFEADRGATAGRDDAIRVPPVSMLEVVDRLPRREAAARLGIDPDRPTVLLTLGSGRLGRVDAPGAVALEALLEHPEWQICVTRTDIAVHTVAVDSERIVELRGVYPLVRYLEAFDAVISAAGYNAVHEFLPANLPTLLVPNPSTQTDDQVARADHLAASGLALCAHPADSSALAEAAHRLLEQPVRDDLAAACAAVPEERRAGGARAAADLLVGAARSHAPLRPSVRQRLALMRVEGRAAVVRLLGPRGTALVKRMLRRPVDRPVPANRVRVVDTLQAAREVPEGLTPLLLSEELPTGGPDGDLRVEHLLATSSERYRIDRERIIDTFYALDPPDWRQEQQLERRSRKRRSG